MKQGEISNQSVDDIEKPWKDKVDALEKVNEVLRAEINELQQEAQSTTEILNQARNKLQECKANEMNIQKELTVKIGLEKEIDRLKSVESKLTTTLEQTENKHTAQLNSSMMKYKEFEQKNSEQQKKIESLKNIEQTYKSREATNASQRERLQASLNTLQIKFQEQKKANEQILNQKSDLESKVDF